MQPLKLRPLPREDALPLLSLQEKSRTELAKNLFQKRRAECQLTLGFLKLLQQTGQIRRFNSYSRRRKQPMRMFA